MPAQIQYDTEGRAVVLNPTNDEENFAEKWQEYPERLKAFSHWLRQVTIDLDELAGLTGLDRIGEFLSKRLGDREVSAVIRAEGQAISRAHQNGRLASTPTGGLTIVSGGASSSRPVRRSTSYGGGH